MEKIPLDMVTKTIALVGALDTKGAEYSFVRDAIQAHGYEVLLIDVGVLGAPVIPPDITRKTIAEAAGADLEALVEERDRGKAVTVMSEGAAMVLPQLHAQGKFHAVMAMGGTGGTSVACAAMRALPLGVPKVMVSTAAGTDVSAYVGVTDIVMVPSIVDVAGINKISREVFARAAGAICGMVKTVVPEAEGRPLITATMFGNTTTAVDHAREILEKAGYEVLVFHCTGIGGRTMESLIEAGKIVGVLDITTTEWADEIAGGVFSAGPTRLEAAAKNGVPAIVTPGCLDMVNWWAPETIPEAYSERIFYRHNPNITLMRTTVEECVQLGNIMAEKLNRSTAAVTVILPLKGFSMIDLKGKDFHLPKANAALCETLKSKLRNDIKVVEMDCEINDPEFSACCAEELIANISKSCIT